MCMDPPNLNKRIYQVWKGRNKFLCGGRLIFGADGISVLLSAFLIGTPALAFSINMFLRIPKFSFFCDLIVMTMGLLITVLDLAFLFMTSATNPGIIPRNTRPLNSDATALPKTKSIIVNGHIVKVKFCDTCFLYRPPRASHCSVCNNCVQRFDHHCPWVGQCIGKRNYKTFFLFIFTSTVLCVYVFVFSLLNLLRETENLGRSISKDVISVVLIIYCFIVVWFVGGLTIFHFYLICKNQTTCENFRYRYDKRRNPYNLGVIENLKEILFSKREPALINFREFVSESGVGESQLRSNFYKENVVEQESKHGVVLQDLSHRIDEYTSEKGAKICPDPLFLDEEHVDGVPVWK